MDGKPGLLTFETTNVALKIESVLKAARIPCTVIPTPVEITTECGLALLVQEKWLGATKEALAASRCTGFVLVHPFERGSAGASLKSRGEGVGT